MPAEEHLGAQSFSVIPKRIANDAMTAHCSFVSQSVSEAQRLL